MHASNRKLRGFVMLLLCLASTMACRRTKPQPDVADVLALLPAEAVTLEVSDGALPRFFDMAVLFQTRSDTSEVIVRTQPRSETASMRALVAGAFLTAARWDWGAYLRRVAARPAGDSLAMASELDDVKFAMRRYLVHLNYRLKKLAAPESVLRAAEALAEHFRANVHTAGDMPYAEIDAGLRDLYVQVTGRVLDDAALRLSYAFGEWLVWQAELAHRCTVLPDSENGKMRAVMNSRYRRADLSRFAELPEALLEGGRKAQAQRLTKAIGQLRHRFIVEQRQGCEGVRQDVLAIFDVLELEFPSSRSYL